VETEANSILQTQIDDRSLFWLGINLSIIGGGVKLVVLAYMGRYFPIVKDSETKLASITIGRVRKIPLSGLISPHLYDCPKPGPGFPTSHVFFCVLWLEVRGGCSFC
jgi:hypothetical protein